MLELLRRAFRRRDLRTLAGLAAGTVPLAAVVHLVAEFVATAPTAIDAFALRHLYLLPLVAAAIATFAATLGAGQGRGAFVRRSALIRAALRRAGPVAGVCDLFVANLAFFALTQLLEGAPIAAGSIAVGLAVAAVGSLIAAVAVFAFGRTLAVALAGAFGTRPRHASPPPRSAARRSRATRSAGRAFTLCLPNRPPPVPCSI